MKKGFSTDALKPSKFWISMKQTYLFTDSRNPLPALNAGTRDALI